MIYRLGRLFFVEAVRQFFRSIRIVGHPPVLKGPVLIVPNHPNHFLDSLMVLYGFPRELWFLGKSTLFKGPLRWILPKLHLVPIYRRQDNPGQLTSNEDTFRVAIEKLSASQAVVIFPEGVSMGERKLFPIKSGAARIALQAETQHNFSLGLTVQPVGLTYTDLDKFRSAVTITLAEPIVVGHFRSGNQREAVDKLTDEIEERLRQVTVEVENSEHAALVEKIAQVFEARDPEIDDRRRFEVIARNVEALAPALSGARKELETRIDAFIQLAALFNLGANEIRMEEKHPLPRLVCVGPFALAGALLFYLPHRLIERLVSMLAAHPVERASLKFGIGIFVYGLTTILAGMLVYAVTLSFGWAAAAGLFVFACGLAANAYFAKVKLLLLSFLWPGRQSPLRVLTLMRDELLNDLEALRVK